MDSNIGRNLMKIIDSIPMLDVQTFDTLMTNQMNVIIFFSINKNFILLSNFFLKDLLMVSYLSNLVKTQLTLNEKLATI
jgi:hypothetical protein